MYRSHRTFDLNLIGLYICDGDVGANLKIFDLREINELGSVILVAGAFLITPW
jgi:hypothetical protein